jgi:hypothetical protein
MITGQESVDILFGLILLNLETMKHGAYGSTLHISTSMF